MSRAGGRPSGPGGHDRGRGRGRGAGRDGGVRWAPVHAPIDSPARWSLRLGVLGGIELRVHALVAAYLALIVVRMAVGPLVGDPAPRDPIILGIETGAVLFAGLLHEAGRLLVAARCAARPLTVSLWPLGGLEDLPPHADWRARVRSAAGGLGSLLAAGLVVGAVLWAATGTLVGVAIPPPIGDPPPGTLVLRDGTQPPWLVVVFALQDGLLAVMALNLVPMAPLAGGRLVEAMLMPSRGRAAARRIAVQAWLISACVLLLASTALGAWLGILAAAVGGVGAAAVLVRDEFAPPDADVDVSPPRAPRGRPAEDIPLAAGPGEVDDVLGELLRDVGVRLEPPGAVGTAAGAGRRGGSPGRPDDEAADAEDPPDADAVTRPVAGRGHGDRREPWIDAAADADLEADAATERGAAPGPGERGRPARGPAAPGTRREAGGSGGAGGHESVPGGGPDPGADEADDAALDLVLEKIARTGLDSLDAADRAVLARATARRRDD